MKIPWVEATWSTEAVKSLSKEFEEQSPHRPTGKEPQNSIPNRLSEIDPASGVLAAFREVEQQAVAYLESIGFSTAPPRRGPIHMLFEKSDAPSNLKKAVKELTLLRNAAAHGVGEISRESASSYIQTASQVAQEIKTLIR